MRLGEILQMINMKVMMNGMYDMMHAIVSIKCIAMGAN
jgi:hypothetical protein